MAGTDKWSTTMKGRSIENDPSIMVKVVVPHGVIFFPSAFTSLVRATSLMLRGIKWSLLRTEQDAPESSKIVTELLFSYPCVYAV